MVKETVLCHCKDALQMKTVAVLIQKASAFRSDIWIAKGQRKANAKSLLGVMSLGIEQGPELVITADGEDEKEALRVIVDYLKCVED